MKNYVELRNEFIYLRLEEKEILCKDVKDFYNEQSFYSKSLRGIKKATQYIKDNFNDDTTFKEVGLICDNFGIRTHYYCAID